MTKSPATEFNVLVIDRDGGVIDRFATEAEARECYPTDEFVVYTETAEEAEAAVRAFDAAADVAQWLTIQGGQ